MSPFLNMLVLVGALPAGSRLGKKMPAGSLESDVAIADAPDLPEVAAEPEVATIDCGDDSLLPGTSLSTVPLYKQRVPVKSRGQTIYKTIFAGQIKVGTPAQAFTVVFDTGSGHLILPGASCRSPACLKHTRFGNSTTTKAIDFDGSPVSGAARDQLTVSFGTGEVTGVFAEDRVCVGADETAACIDAHLITATAMTDKPFLEFDFDGVLGLGLSGLSQTPRFNLGAQIKQRAMFSVYLSELGGSEINFGGWKSSLLASPQEPLLWAPVEDPEDGYWKLAVTDVVVDGERLDFCDNGCHAVADTGTSVLAAPGVVVSWMRQRLAQRLYMQSGECAIDNNATIEVVLENNLRLVLDARDFAQPRINANSSAETCELLLMRMDVPAPLGPLFILGEPFLTKYYTVFDVDQLRVGFGLAKRTSAEGSTEGESVTM